MLRFFTILLSFSTLLLFAASPAKAYWIDPPKPEPFTMHGARETAPPSEKKGLFTVQDNFNLFTREDGSTPILLPHSDYFVAADTINANLPIFGIFSHPIKPAGDPIVNLIYADLKLKKLTEQYIKLQEKAKKLLSNHYSAISDGTIKTTELTSIKQELQQLSTKLSTVNTAKIMSDASAAKSTHSSEADNLLITLHQLKSRQKQQQQKAKIAMNVTPKVHQPSMAGIKGATSPNDSKSPTASTPNNHGHPFAGSEEITIPYLIKLPLRIFRYILRHKFESLFMGFFILMFTSIIFGSRS